MTMDMAESIIEASNITSLSTPGYQPDISNKELASGMMQQGVITLYDLVKLVSENPNDAELGKELRKLLKEKIV